MAEGLVPELKATAAAKAPAPVPRSSETVLEVFQNSAAERGVTPGMIEGNEDVHGKLQGDRIQGTSDFRSLNRMWRCSGLSNPSAKRYRE